jgi:hypothetical protein
VHADDLPALHTHLDLALRHLEAASALTSGLTETPELATTARYAVNEDAAEAGLLIDRLTHAMAGASLDDEFARLLAAD